MKSRNLNNPSSRAASLDCLSLGKLRTYAMYMYLHVHVTVNLRSHDNHDSNHSPYTCGGHPRFFIHDYSYCCYSVHATLSWKFTFRHAFASTNMYMHCSLNWINRWYRFFSYVHVHVESDGRSRMYLNVIIMIATYRATVVHRCTIQNAAWCYTTATFYFGFLVFFFNFGPSATYKYVFVRLATNYLGVRQGGGGGQ